MNPALLSILLIFAAVLWMLQDERDKTRVLLFFGILINIVYGTIQQLSMKAMGGLLPWKYDHILYRLDGALGVSAPLIARSLPGPALIALTLVYQLLVPMMILSYLYGAGQERRRNVSIAYFAELAVGPLLYAILPACGPIYAFPLLWPNPAENVSLQVVQLEGMPNAFPSLHLATALVILAFARRGLLRILAGVFFGATAVATIATGEHYVIDLVAGITFGCFAYSAGCRRHAAALTFFVLTAVYAVCIRFAPILLLSHPLLLREVVIATVAASALYIVRAMGWNDSSVASVQPLSTPLAASAE